MKLPIPSSREPVLQDLVFNRTWFSYLEGVFKAIKGNTDIKLGGLLSINTDNVANINTGTTDLIGYILNANSLATNGDVLQIEASGTFAANTNNKKVTLNFGSQEILTTGSIIANDGSWSIKATIVLTASATQEIMTTIISGTTNVTISSTRAVGVQESTNDIIIKCTGTGVASNDIIHRTLLINLYPNS